MFCEKHGETDRTYVCRHLAEESCGLGFNRETPSKIDPFNCEIIGAANGGWTEQASSLAEIKAICSGCYERTRICNTRPSETLDDLAALR